MTTAEPAAISLVSQLVQQFVATAVRDNVGSNPEIARFSRNGEPTRKMHERVMTTAARLRNHPGEIWKELDKARAKLNASGLPMDDPDAARSMTQDIYDRQLAKTIEAIVFRCAVDDIGKLLITLGNNPLDSTARIILHTYKSGSVRHSTVQKILVDAHLTQIELQDGNLAIHGVPLDRSQLREMNGGAMRAFDELAKEMRKHSDGLNDLLKSVDAAVGPRLPMRKPPEPEQVLAQARALHDQMSASRETAERKAVAALTMLGTANGARRDVEARNVLQAAHDATKQAWSDVAEMSVEEVGREVGDEAPDLADFKIREVFGVAPESAPETVASAVLQFGSGIGVGEGDLPGGR